MILSTMVIEKAAEELVAAVQQDNLQTALAVTESLGAVLRSRARALDRAAGLADTLTELLRQRIHLVTTGPEAKRLTAAQRQKLGMRPREIAAGIRIGASTLERRALRRLAKPDSGSG